MYIVVIFTTVCLSCLETSTQLTLANRKFPFNYLDLVSFKYSRIKQE